MINDFPLRLMNRSELCRVCYVKILYLNLNLNVTVPLEKLEPSQSEFLLRLTERAEGPLRKLLEARNCIETFLQTE